MIMSVALQAKNKVYFRNISMLMRSLSWKTTAEREENVTKVLYSTLVSVSNLKMKMNNFACENETACSECF